MTITNKFNLDNKLLRLGNTWCYALWNQSHCTPRGCFSVLHTQFGKGNVHRVGTSRSKSIDQMLHYRFLIMAENHKTPRIMKRIGTHSGVFHCDEALACYLLKQLPEYRDAEIIRTRNSDVCILTTFGGVIFIDR